MASSINVMALKWSFFNENNLASELKSLAYKNVTFIPFIFKVYIRPLIFFTINAELVTALVFKS